jgi:hypothetical protein
MTTPNAHLLVHRSRTARRADPLLAALLAAAVAGIVALVLALPAPHSTPAPRMAVVIDAGGDSRAALARARSLAGADAAVRVPRTPAQAAVDLRYLAAAGYTRVVVAGPVVRGAAHRVAPDAPRTRFVAR